MGKPDKHAPRKSHSRRAKAEAKQGPEWFEPVASSSQDHDPGDGGYGASNIPRSSIAEELDLQGLSINGPNEDTENYDDGTIDADIASPLYTHQNDSKGKYPATGNDDGLANDAYDLSYADAGAEPEGTAPWGLYSPNNPPGYGYDNSEGQLNFGGQTQPSISVDHQGTYQGGESSAAYAAPAYEMPNNYGEEDYVDPAGVGGYHVEHGSRFQPGEIFKMMWSTPRGADVPSSPVPTEHNHKDNPDFFVGPRRFIVVATDVGNHSTCVPIFTYGRKGCKKKGLRPQAHGIVYSTPGAPKKLSGEPDLGFQPVAVNMYAELEKLDKASRVNYSKLTDIEHNVPVVFIGQVDPSYFGIVQDAVNTCWEEKQKEQVSRPKHRSSKRH